MYNKTHRNICLNLRTISIALIAQLSLLFSVQAENQIIKIEFPLLNQGVIYLTELPKSYSSQLSSDKKVITVNISKTTIQAGKLEKASTGVIQSIAAVATGANVSITINCNDKRGYTIAPLPYSKALSIEVFRWDKLNSSEDNYRSGLLALNDGLISSAKNYFIQAYNSDNANAAAQLGMIFLQEGKLKTATKYLLDAHKGGSNIPDAYAAISQIFKLYKNQNRADYFSNVFMKKSGLDSFNQLEIPKDSINNDTSGIRELLKSPAFGDTVRIFTARDSVSSALNKPYIKADTIRTFKKESKDNIVWEVFKSLFPPWISNAIIIGIIFLFCFVIYLYFRYLKWRKQQLAIKEKVAVNDFGKNLITAQTTLSNKSQAFKAYNKANDSAQTNPKSSEEPIAKPKQKIILDDVPVNTKPKEENLINFEDKLERIARELLAASKAGRDSDDKDDSAVTPSVKLAMHLQDEKKRIKKEQFDNIEDFDIPSDVNLLGEVAKKLGVEKGSLQAKRDISILKNDEKELSKLAGKFSVYKKKE